MSIDGLGAMIAGPKPSTVAAARPVTTEHRLGGLDALRGLAAVLVMLFHYTTRYQMDFGHSSAPWFEVSWGHLGVVLFFMISGFVIFMTLERTRRPGDFLVSRFSRLYPPFWVCAVLAYGLSRWTPEIGNHLSGGQAFANGLMFHALFGVPDIDGAYWTLEVELLFYWAMFLLWLTVGLSRPGRWMGPWLALSVLSAGLPLLGIRFPYFVTNVFILAYVPYFAIGVLLYLRFMRGAFRWSVEGVLGAVALLAIALHDRPGRLAWMVVFVPMFVLVTFRWSSTPVVRMMAGLGAISYPLYLIHETLGWSLIHLLEGRGFSANAAIGVAIATALVTATVLHLAVEKPAMEIIRRAWKARRHLPAGAGAGDMPHRPGWIAATVLVGCIALMASHFSVGHPTGNVALAFHPTPVFQPASR